MTARVELQQRAASSREVFAGLKTALRGCDDVRYHACEYGAYTCTQFSRVVVSP
jgi:hypothetical protein